MINSILTAILTYFLSFFPLPRWVKKVTDSLRRRFLWSEASIGGKGFCLVNWNRVCICKEFGGLGIINLRDFNTTTTLLINWWWKLFDELGHKCTLLISHNYCLVTGW